MSVTMGHVDRRLLALALIAAVMACDPTPAQRPEAGSPVRTPGDVPELAAVDPAPPSLEEFASEARAECGAAVAVIEARPLRGDPLAPYAKRRDVRAAVRHYTAAARAWSDAAGALFAFGPAEDPGAQRFISALDVLAMQSRQVAEALAADDADAAQASLVHWEHAVYEADAAARDVGVGPLLQCGTPTLRTAANRRVSLNAVDFGFRLPQESLQAGATRFVLRNRGSEDHQLFVVPLREPGTLSSAVTADREGEPLQRYLAGRGATTPVARPGQRVAVDVDLEPGPYGLLCFVASPDGTPHAYKGMYAEFDVAR